MLHRLVFISIPAYIGSYFLAVYAGNIIGNNILNKVTGNITKQIAKQSASSGLGGGAEVDGFNKTLTSLDINILPKSIIYVILFMSGVIIMNNKKVVIGIILAILVIVAIGFGIFKATHNEDYLYNQDGTVVDGKKDLIESIKKMENAEERKNKIDFSVEHNILTQQEANELY